MKITKTHKKLKKPQKKKKTKMVFYLFLWNIFDITLLYETPQVKNKELENFMSLRKVKKIETDLDEE